MKNNNSNFSWKNCNVNKIYATILTEVNFSVLFWKKGEIISLSSVIICFAKKKIKGKSCESGRLRVKIHCCDFSRWSVTLWILPRVAEELNQRAAACLTIVEEKIESIKLDCVVDDVLHGARLNGQRDFFFFFFVSQRHAFNRSVK